MFKPGYLSVSKAVDFFLHTYPQPNLHHPHQIYIFKVRFWSSLADHHVS